MVNDATSPVAAARYYAYTTLASYEMVSLFNPSKYPSFGGYINGFEKQITNTTDLKSVDRNFAIVLTVLKSGEKLLPSGYLLRNEIDSFIKTSGLKTEKLEQVVKLTDLLISRIISYSRQDGFTKLTNYTRYTPFSGDAYWQPTPPTFMAGIEPYWNKVRTFILDSAQQFKPLPPAKYSTDKNSDYYKQLLEVYETVNKNIANEVDIANFWDCNPFAVQQIGHVEYALKKISPGGHWIGITGIASLKSKLSLQETVKAHTLVSIALSDAFIACWDEKYRSNRVRPETAIKKLINPNWKPILQTPPFPEYVSGHSVASTAAAEVLTKFFGAKFSFKDDTEVEFGLPARNFSSFKQASGEAAISRLYGGIHYRDAIDQGVWQGHKVAQLILKKLSPFFKK